MIYGKLWQNLWQLMATYGKFWQIMTNYSKLWQTMATYGNIWKLLATYGNLVPSLVPKLKICCATCISGVVFILRYVPNESVVGQKPARTSFPSLTFCKNSLISTFFIRRCHFHFLIAAQCKGFCSGGKLTRAPISFSRNLSHF